MRRLHLVAADALRSKASASRRTPDSTIYFQVSPLRLLVSDHFATCAFFSAHGPITCHRSK
jgi:hypothetical protein